MAYWRSWDLPRPVSKATKVERAARGAAKLAKDGKKLDPVTLERHTIASTFWGKAWCSNLESYGDYSNRLPRGRSYLRTGAVLHLAVEEGRVTGLVQGSRLYEVTVKIAPLRDEAWSAVVRAASGRIDSLVDVLRGSLPDEVARAVTLRHEGLFPEPSEIAFACTCPDWASMCKHVAAVLYGVGARLDRDPGLLFVLRRADPADLVTHAVRQAALAPAASGRVLDAGTDLEALFGIELELPEKKAEQAPARKRRKETNVAAATEPITWTRRELEILGVPLATVERWVRRGILVVGKRGRLVETAEARRKIAKYAERAEELEP